MKQPTVLIVDDDPDIVDYLGSFLEDEDYKVATAMSASAALGFMPVVQPDVVLIDVMMPGRSGLDLLVSIRKDDRWSNVSVVMITGSDQVIDDHCQSYMSSFDGIRGPDRVLGKPVDRAALRELLLELAPKIQN